MRVEENEKEKILVYYGDYKIDGLYQINDFLFNQDLNLFKLQQVYKSGNKLLLKPRYIVLTDIYFLLFDPIKDNKEMGKLLFWGDIRQLNNSKGSTEYTNHLIVEWKSQTRSIVTFELVFENINIKDFMEIASRRIIRLKDNFKIFHDELMKSNDDKPKDYEKIILLIKFKEDLLQQKHSPHTVKELINLYQNVIEILTERNDDNYKIFLDKMKIMLDKEDKLINDADTTASTKGFELSKSYYSTTHEDAKYIKK